MPQEDRLKREIDALGRLLVKLLGELTGLKNDPEPEHTLEEVKKILQDEAGLDLISLLESEPESFHKILNEKNLTNSHLEQLADIFYQWALLEKNNTEAAKAYRKALVLYEKVSENTSTFSLDRHYKIENSKKILLSLD